MKKALVMLSGGMDSATALVEATKAYRVSAIFFDYGQRSADLDLTAARQIARHFGVPLEVVDVSGLKRLFLGLKSAAIVALGFKDVGDGMGAGNCPHGLFGVASTYCISAGIDVLISGMHADDVIGLNNPAGYFSSWAAGMRDLQGVNFEFGLPYIEIGKAKVVKVGSSLGVPFELTRSCSSESVTHCGVCEPCKKRRSAFLEASIKDPTAYTQKI